MLASLQYVIDGDTIQVFANGQSFKTRARWIDAPETRKSGDIPRSEADLNQWEWGERSCSYLSTILENQQLIIVPYELDQYGRTLADWYVGKVRRSDNVQVRMAEYGMAVDMLPYQRYILSSKDITLYVAILRGQHNARRKKLGIWSDLKFQLPGAWRAQ